METGAINRIVEQQFVDDIEMDEIHADRKLAERIKKGSQQKRVQKGPYVEKISNILDYTVYKRPGRDC